jgi:seryl-tRNA synthetase
MKKLLDDGFMPMYVPLLVKDRALFGSSQFPADQDQIYKIENANIEDNNALYLIGSSEPSLFAYYQDSVIANTDFPIKVFTTTTCFRSEAGSWGKDVRGIKRMHQFEKLEMDVIIPNDKEEALRMHEYLLSLNEWLLQLLEIPYHVINMCTGDLGYAAAAKKYDIEVFLPSSKSYMEVMSDSITTDFQTRRLNIRYIDQNNEKQYAYTLNDTGATHRLLIAIIEHYQQSDGSIKIPEALKPYFKKDFIK